MKQYKRTTIMLAYRVRSLRASKLSQQAIANKLGISQKAVSKILTGETQLLSQCRIADRMAHFGMLGKDGNSRRRVTKWNGDQLRTDSEALHSRHLHADDPLAILLAHERFGRVATVLDGVPPRIDTPQPEEIVVHTDTWPEFVQSKFRGNEKAAYMQQRPDGSSILATEGAYVSSYAVRDTLYEYGYPYRNTVAEREYVAALSIQRRRARARLGREFLLSLDPVLSTGYESTSTQANNLVVERKDVQYVSTNSSPEERETEERGTNE